LKKKQSKLKKEIKTADEEETAGTKEGDEDDVEKEETNGNGEK
jgi:hypothetical protein